MDQSVESVAITENLDVVSGSLTEEDTVTPVTNKSNGEQSDKGKQNMTEEAGNEKSKTRNIDAKKVKAVPAPERESLKRKAEHPPTSEIVMDSIKTLGKCAGATFENIGKYMEEKYPVEMNTLNPYINMFLKKIVDDDQAFENVAITENLNAVSGSLTEEDTMTPITKESNGEQSDKGKQNMKEEAGNEKSKTRNIDAKKVKDVPAPERKSLKKKAEHPPTSEMVMDSIKALRKRTGATFEDIGKYMEEKYAVEMKTMKSHINKFLKKSVDDDVLEKIDGAGDQERFKIKKSENIKKNSKNVIVKDGKGKPMKKMIATKTKVKK